MEYVSVVLVSGGIIGELGIGIKIASINGELQGVDTQLRTKSAELRSKSDQLVKLVTQQAGGAADSAERANTAAGEAKSKADRVGVEVDAAQTTLDALSTKADQIDQGLSKTQEDLKNSDALIREQFDNLKPRQVTCLRSPNRNLYSGDRKTRIEEVAKYNRTPVLIEVLTSDDWYEFWRVSDTEHLAENIDCLLRDAGFDPQFTAENTPVPPWNIQPGVQVFSVDDRPIKPRYLLSPIPTPPPLPPATSFAASALVNLLDLDLGPDAGKLPGVSKRTVHPEYRIFSDPRFPKGSVLIVVGPKLEYGWSDIFSSQPRPETEAQPSKKNPKSTPSPKP